MRPLLLLLAYAACTAEPEPTVPVAPVAPVEQPAPQPAATLRAWSTLAVGAAHTCVADAAGEGCCVGTPLGPDIGPDTPVSPPTPLRLPGLSAIVGGGRWRTCALAPNGQVTCMLPDQAPELVPDLRLEPSANPPLALGEGHACGVKPDHTLACWGWNVRGQLGVGDTERSELPRVVVGLGAVKGVAAGAYHTCALTSAGLLGCWGENAFGQLGSDKPEFSPNILKVSLDGVVGVAAGYTHTCAVLSDGEVRCFGANGSYQLGDGTQTARANPMPTASLPPATSVCAGLDHSCALTRAGEIWCWGGGSAGATGTGDGVNAMVPRNTHLMGAVALGCGARHTCALLADGEVVCWGDNSAGQLGTSTRATARAPASFTACEAPSP